MKNFKYLCLGLFVLIGLNSCDDDSDGAFVEPMITGPETAFHGGSARSFVTRGTDGSLQSIGVRLSESALQGLPTDTSAMHGQQVLVPLPAEAAPTGIDHVELSWNPQGHPPQGIYSLPHFDLHFYLVTPEEQAAVIPGPDTVRVDSQFIPADYISTVVAEPKMGVHYVDTTSAEFHGQPFTTTFIYGFYRGEMTFLEPMFTLDFLLSKQNFSAEIKQPQRFQNSGYYPSSYSISYDSQNQEYVITLDDLQSRTGSQ